MGPILRRGQTFASWQRFIRGQPPESSLPRVILESWERSRAAGIDPDPEDPPFRRIADQELQQRSKASQDLLSAASSHLQWLSASMAPVPHGVYLTDRDGIILYAISNTTEPLRKGRLLPGFDWSEQAMGTNGAGTALVANQPVAIVGCEHYCRPWHDDVCTAAPIHAVDGTVIGAIDICTGLAHGNPERLMVAAHIAYSIEQELAGQKSRQRARALRTLLAERNRLKQELAQARDAAEHRAAEAEEGRKILEAIMAYIPEGITIADAPDVRIRMVSRYGQQLTGRPLEVIEGVSAEEHAEKWGLYCSDGITQPTGKELPLTRAIQLGMVVKDEEWVIRRPDGEAIPILCNTGPIYDQSGKITGGVIAWRDITKLRRAEEERERLMREQLQQYEFLGALIEKSPIGIAVVEGPDHCYVLANPAYRAILGAPDTPVVGRTMAEVFPAEVIRDYLEILEEVYRTGKSISMREYQVSLGAGRASTYWNAENVPLRGIGNRTEAVMILAHEMTQEVRSRQRLGFLADASAFLASSLDYETTLQRVTNLMIPTLADYCSVDLMEPGGREPRQVAVAHTDPSKEPLVREVRRLYPFDPSRPYGLSHVICTGQPELVSQISETWREAMAPNAEVLRIFRALDFKSYMIVPLKARGQMLGAITLGSSVSGRHYGPDDLALAEELARRAATAIDNARLHREIQEAGQRKDEFLAMLSHELRNPLAAIVGAIEVLRLRGSEDPMLRYAQETAGRQARQMRRLLDDLLDVSRITRGKIVLHKEPVDLTTIVSHAIQTVRALIQERGHALSISLPPEPLRLEADPTRLEQVLTNILSNAAKYTEPGGRIELTARREGDEAVLRVRDNGMGISPEILPRIFDLFVQAERSLDRSQGGLGIGLTMVQSLVEMHGGKVEAYSAGPDQGSEFMVRLPALPTLPEDQPHASM